MIKRNIKLGIWLEKMFKSVGKLLPKNVGMVIKNRLTSGVTVLVSVLFFFA